MMNESVTWIQIGGLDRADAEALTLELRQVAERYGIEIREVRIDRESDAGDPSG